MKTMGQTLPYAPTPPRDRAEVVWQGEEFDITIPPRITHRGILVFLLVCTAAVGAFHIALSPGGRLPMIARLGALAPGVLVVLLLVATFRQLRTWTRLSLRKGYLECSTPAMKGFATRRFWLVTLRDASVGHLQRGGDTGEMCLLLHHSDGETSALLDDTIYREADLRLAADAIRRAIAGKPPASVAQ